MLRARGLPKSAVESFSPVFWTRWTHPSALHKHGQPMHLFCGLDLLMPSSLPGWSWKSDSFAPMLAVPHCCCSYSYHNLCWSFQHQLNAFWWLASSLPRKCSGNLVAAWENSSFFLCASNSFIIHLMTSLQLLMEITCWRLLFDFYATHHLVLTPVFSWLISCMLESSFCLSFPVPPWYQWYIPPPPRQNALILQWCWHMQHATKAVTIGDGLEKRDMLLVGNLCFQSPSYTCMWWKMLSTMQQPTLTSNL